MSNFTLILTKVLATLSICRATLSCTRVNKSWTECAWPWGVVYPSWFSLTSWVRELRTTWERSRRWPTPRSFTMAWVKRSGMFRLTCHSPVKWRLISRIVSRQRSWLMKRCEESFRSRSTALLSFWRNTNQILTR